MLKKRPLKLSLHPIHHKHKVAIKSGSLQYSMATPRNSLEICIWLSDLCKAKITPCTEVNGCKGSKRC